jgi:hypothetical protein
MATVEVGEALRNARAVYLIDGSGNPVGGTATPTLAVQQRPGDTWITATAAISTAATATVPAPAAGLFNYITYWSVVLFAGAALTPAATPVLVPITGLSGSPVLAFPNAGAQGTTQEQKYEGQAPLKAAAAAATVVFSAPVLTGGIWRINVAYYQAP